MCSYWIPWFSASSWLCRRRRPRRWPRWTRGRDTRCSVGVKFQRRWAARRTWSADTSTGEILSWRSPHSRRRRSSSIPGSSSTTTSSTTTRSRRSRGWRNRGSVNKSQRCWLFAEWIDQSTNQRTDHCKLTSWQIYVDKLHKRYSHNSSICSSACIYL